MNEFNLFGKREPLEIEPPELPMTFEANGQVVTFDEIDYFIRKVHNVQRQGKAPFSRPDWMRRHKPPLTRMEYDARILWLDLAGVIGGRGKGKSGKLITSPANALGRVKAVS